MWQNGSQSWEKGTWLHLEFVKRHMKDSEHETKDSVVWWNENWTLWPECKALLLAETEHSSLPIEHHPYREAWWWQHHALGCYSAVGTGKLVRIEGAINGAKSLRRTCLRVQKTWECGKSLHSSRTMTPSIQPKQHWNGFRTRMWKSLSGLAKAQT